ncbi:MAG: ureidoglycolate hydrolase [Acidiferrobacteraceae bacterium]|nr:ureidoglycolate hydrolase [Acidiferrobacteraceae bacterium]MBT5980117.1 ureidoglycolate hydrolase [Acidiferrobacteraceae bacterium]
MTANAPQYLFDPADKPSLPLHEVPLVEATDDSVQGYGCLVDHPDDIDIEIVRWPATGWRKVDEDSGDEGGWVEGIFHGEWQGDVLYGRNEAVSGHYVLGWSTTDPQLASTTQQTAPRDQVLLWHMNYHPDGGQLFFPQDRSAFVVPVALPGDDLAVEQVIALWCDGSRGLYIHPGIWHDGIFPAAQRQRFLDRQGRVHARVSCDLAAEFGVYLSVPLVHG